MMFGITTLNAIALGMQLIAAVAMLRGFSGQAASSMQTSSAIT
ncbi:hypothetical protein J2W51_002339 [Tardiphaga robiniae]|nr:hypothetical protein [Tardiphaga robiniae]